MQLINVRSATSLLVPKLTFLQYVYLNNIT